MSLNIVLLMIVCTPVGSKYENRAWAMLCSTDVMGFIEELKGVHGHAWAMPALWRVRRDQAASLELSCGPWSEHL